MDSAGIFIMAIATAINIMAIKWKLENDRLADAGLDAIILVALGWVFGGTVSGLAIATLTSAIISAYLLISPPSLTFLDD